MENELLLAYDHGVPCIVPALIPGHELGLFRKDIYELPLALVPPLRAYYYGS